MRDNKKNLIVTLADANFVAQAKQLFSSVYYNAGWDGDYLLLAQGISETDKAWFESKGILVYECEPLTETPVGYWEYYPIVLSKLYLFKEYFKQWGKVIFLDADMIVRGSLEELIKIEGFGAVKSYSSLKEQFFQEDYKLLKKLKKSYRLIGKSFNSGFFIFDTSLLSPTTFNDLLSLYKEFESINLCGEESTLNLFFYRRWEELPIIYSSVPRQMQLVYKIDKDKLRAYIIHFMVYSKPWNPESDYYTEWLSNLQKADNIDLAIKQKPLQIASKDEIDSYLRYIKLIDLKLSWSIPFLFIDRQIGRLGLFIKKKTPNLYKLISLKKDGR